MDIWKQQPNFSPIFFDNIKKFNENLSIENDQATSISFNFFSRHPDFILSIGPLNTLKFIR